MKQPNFMTCSGKAGWRPEEINSPRSVASFGPSESKKGSAESGTRSTLFYQNGSLGK